MKIAYQGIEGSFSHRAARKIAERQGLDGFELSGVVSAAAVCRELAGGNADFGVVALRNSIGGTVEETRLALADHRLRQIDEIALPISQCLFKRHPALPESAIRCVASHLQALKQCRRTIRTLFPAAQLMPVEDTALAAHRLREGFYSPDTAVICSLEAGLLHSLCLIRQGVEDRAGNTTWFALLAPPCLPGY